MRHAQNPRQDQGRLTPSRRRLAVFGLLCVALVNLSVGAAQAQLPPVNMGRWVHQPGDNQYSTSTQQSRHGGGPAPAAAAVPINIPLATGGWRPTPKPRRDDISVLPVVCDEPVPPAGFPPMPDTLDMPGVRGGSIMRGAPSMGGGGFSSSYGGVGGGSVQIGGGAQVRQSQGYTTTAPGAFVQKKTPYGAANNGGGDVYASGDGASTAPRSAAQSALNRMGKEPTLDDKNRNSAPEAPQAMQVNQATSQDLSLPDDDMTVKGRKSQSQGGKIFNRTVGRMGNRMINSINSMPLPVRIPR